MKSYDSLRLCALFVHADYWVVQQAALGGLLHDPEGGHTVHMHMPAFLLRVAL